MSRNTIVVNRDELDLIEESVTEILELLPHCEIEDATGETADIYRLVALIFATVRHMNKDVDVSDNDGAVNGGAA